METTDKSRALIPEVAAGGAPQSGDVLLSPKKGTPLSRIRKYPLDEGEVPFKFVCPGCGRGRSTTVPRHYAPYVWRCTSLGCGWSMQIQSDPTGLAIGFTAPMPEKTTPGLVLVKGGADAPRSEEETTEQ
jgi:hypothetical protein